LPVSGWVELNPDIPVLEDEISQRWAVAAAKFGGPAQLPGQDMMKSVIAVKDNCSPRNIEKYDFHSFILSLFLCLLFFFFFFL
jgi:hypothetical protein